MDGVYEGPVSPGTCRACGGGNLEIKWLRPISDIASMVLNQEWVALEAFPIAVVCPSCGHDTTGMGENFTIDITRGVITYGFIRVDEP